MQVSYQMKLSNDHNIHVDVFVVSSQPQEVSGDTDNGQNSYQWNCVTRSESPHSLKARWPFRGVIHHMHVVGNGQYYWHQMYPQALSKHIRAMSLLICDGL